MFSLRMLFTRRIYLCIGIGLGTVLAMLSVSALLGCSKPTQNQWEWDESWIKSAIKLQEKPLPYNLVDNQLAFYSAVYKYQVETNTRQEIQRRLVERWLRTGRTQKEVELVFGDPHIVLLPRPKTIRNSDGRLKGNWSKAFAFSVWKYMIHYYPGGTTLEITFDEDGRVKTYQLRDHDDYFNPDGGDHDYYWSVIEELFETFVTINNYSHKAKTKRQMEASLDLYLLPVSIDYGQWAIVDNMSRTYQVISEWRRWWKKYNRNPTGKDTPKAESE